MSKVVGSGHIEIPVLQREEIIRALAPHEKLTLTKDVQRFYQVQTV